MIEKGVPVPPELFLNPRNNLRRGVVLCGVGTGSLILFMIEFLRGAPDLEFWLIGVIPLLMGISYIIVWKLQDGEKNNVASFQTQ
jgi:cadmium resistance protein CadD (predicted permease)